MRHEKRLISWWLNPSWYVVGITLEPYRVLIRIGRLVVQIGGSGSI